MKIKMEHYDRKAKAFIKNDCTIDEALDTVIGMLRTMTFSEELIIAGMIRYLYDVGFDFENNEKEELLDEIKKYIY